MNNHKFNFFYKKIQSLFDSILKKNDEPDKQLFKRIRKIIPDQFLSAIISAVMQGNIRGVSCLKLHFVDLTGISLSYRACYYRVSKPAFADTMRQLLGLLLAEFKSQVLEFKKDSPFKVFKRIFAHDGCSMGLHKGLKNAFPGRFSETSPAAIELHCTMDLLNDSLDQVILAPDTHAERQYMPDWTDQSSVLGLLDCGYFDTQQMDQWSASNVHYIVRASISINPEIVACSSNPKLVGKKLKDAYSKFKKRQPTDLQVRWKGCEHNVRLIVRWNRDQEQFESLATNLQEDQFSADDVRQGYRLRWQIELLFKEWKSLTNLKKINTRNPEIAEGLIWASLIGALLRRIMAYQSEQVVDQVLSTWQASKLGTSQITEYWRWFVRKNTDRAKECWDQLMWLLGEETGRQNKKRDNKKGRCNSGLVMISTLND